MAALRLLTEKLIPHGVTPDAVITYGAPRSGDEAFATAYNNSVHNHWRFEHRNDVVAHVPPRPGVLLALKSLESIKGLPNLFKTMNPALDDYTPVGNLCFLDWNDKLKEGSTRLLEFEREGRLIIAGNELVDDHFVDAYMGAMKKAFASP